MDVDVEEYMKSINLEAVCRTCLTDGEEMTSLFSEVQMEESETEEEENYILLYEILSGISPMQVCDKYTYSCYDLAMIFFRYQQMTGYRH